MNNNFGEILFDLRRKRKMLQKQLAADAGLDQSYLAGLERGRREPPKSIILEKIFESLNVSKEERAHLNQAILISRIEKLLKLQGYEVPGNKVLLKIASALPFMHIEELEAIGTIASSYQQKRERNSAM